MRRWCVLSGALAFAPVPTTASYGQPPCTSGESQGELQGATGYLCAPRCDAATYNCPTDVPFGATAQPQCMLKDVDQAAHCALLCQVDSQCPSGARCNQLKQAEVGTCLYPVSFADWARNSQIVTKKFALGCPSSGGSGSPANFQIAKTYAALQNLKGKYSIDDGDADMVTLKEFLSSITGGAGAASGVKPAGASPPALGLWPFSGGAGATPGATSGVTPAGVSPPAAKPAVPSPSPETESNSGVGGDFAAGKWTHDFSYFANNMRDGVPGIKREIRDSIWNMEHMDERGVACSLLRSITMVTMAYIGIGCAYKGHMTGARGMDMIPHIGFWSEYPRLVADGIIYTQILAGGLLGAPKAADDLTGGLRAGGSLSRGVGGFDAL